ncbi:MAG: hypothetical protein QG618_1050, partial [Thermodesulfobacteriota bacterium]|nr:hypothetical protein [Thermodesulfobacteriota bacterium]
TDEKDKNIAMLKKQTAQKKNDQINTQIYCAMKEERRT